MKRYLIVVIICLSFLASAGAQVYTPVSANGITVDNGSGTAINPPSGSTLCFLGTNQQGTPVTYTPQGGSPVAGTVCQTFTSGGNLSGSFQVANAATATPIGLHYTVTISNGTTTYLILSKVSVSGSFFNFSTYALPGNGMASGIGYPHILCNQGAMWTSTTVSPGAATCAMIGGIGSWISYPHGGSYCPAGQGYVTPQITGEPFCISPTLTGLGAPAGACIKNSTYFQQDAANGQFLWGCINEAWQQVSGSGGSSGITTFQGRSTPAATLQTGDVTGILANGPFSLNGSRSLLFDNGSGTFGKIAQWLTDGSGNIVGTGALALNNGSSNTIFFNPNGAAYFANNQFSIDTAGGLMWGGGPSISSSSNLCQSNGTNCPSATNPFYQVNQNSGTGVTQRARNNFVNSSGIVATDDPSNDSTDIALSGIPNASLANPSITINVTGGATGGGTVALGGSTTIDVTGGGGGGSPAGVANDLQINSGSSTFAADSGNLTNNSTTHTLAQHFFSDPISTNRWGSNQRNDLAQDFLDTVTPFAGDSRNPWTVLQSVTEGYSKNPGIQPQGTSIYNLSGGQNTNSGDPGPSPGVTGSTFNGVGGNWQTLGLTAFGLTPGQNGGNFSEAINHLAPGDGVAQTITDFGRGVSRGEDEGIELWRIFLASTNDIAGGFINTATVNAQNDIVLNTSQLSGFSLNNYEMSFLVDINSGSSFASPGNIQGIYASPSGTFAGYTRYQLDSSAGVFAHYGASTTTTLTNAIDSYAYAGTCPTWTSGGDLMPTVAPLVGIGDGFITDWTGTGVTGRNSNYNGPSGTMTGYCITVASTSGMTTGTTIFISGTTQGTLDFQMEFAKVISVVDGTHFTAFVHNAHSVGATISWGGAVGYGMCADMDIIGPGTNDTIQNSQTAFERTCYPIVNNTSSDLVDVYNLGGLTLVPQNNAPRTPLVISAPVVSGGELISFTANALNGDGTDNDYTTDALGTYVMGTKYLPAPVITVSSECTGVVIDFSSASFDNSKEYVPVITSGGTCTGTPTITVASTLATPFHIMPMGEVYRSLDPTKPVDKSYPMNSVDGVFTIMPVVAGFLPGETIQQVQWWAGRGAGTAQVNMDGPVNNNMGGTFGGILNWTVSNVAGQSTHFNLTNRTKTTAYYGEWDSATNSFVTRNPLEGSNLPLQAIGLQGVYKGGLEFAFPPTLSAAGNISGGTENSVSCAIENLSGIVDHPCLHNIFIKYYVHRDNELGSSIGSDIYVDPNSGDNGFESQSGQGPGSWTATNFKMPYALGNFHFPLGSDGSHAALNNAASIPGNFVGLGDGTVGKGTQNGSLGLATIHAANVVAGAEIPVNAGLFLSDPSHPGTATAQYVCTSNTQEGETLPAPVQSTNTAPLVLGGTQSAPNPGVFVKCLGTPGAQTIKVYRHNSFGTYTAGLIGEYVPGPGTPSNQGQGFYDVGQTAGTAEPTADTSGLMTINDGMMELNSILYFWPATHTAGFMKDDGSGNLSWQANGVTASGGTSCTITAITNGIVTAATCI